ncbi:MAG: sigma-70 family RNA polymerase sigma factor [Planctomycetaceae bacterium]|nr:sigma-70 family RNA polymerase sigma factor [Planctomycetaceae bacterium]
MSIVPAPSLTVPPVVNSTQVETPLTDAALLAQFIDRRDALSVRAVMHRFGPLVYAVASRTVRDHHLAEDVFQAVFLVLVRDAESIRNWSSVGAWLHGVTLRIARKALSKQSRSRSGDLSMIQGATPSVLDELHRQYSLQVLDEELNKLPATYRDVLVQHFLEGKTCQETAQALGTSDGTIRGRLQRGKRLLHTRLVRRGIDFSVFAVGMAIWKLAPTAVPQHLLTGSIQACMTFCESGFTESHCNSHVLQLAQEVSMTSSTFTAVAAKAGAALLVLATISALGWTALAAPPATTPPAINSQVQVTASVPATSNELAFADPAPAIAENAEEAPRILRYHDGTPDGKKSIAGTGLMTQFDLPQATQKLVSVRLHCARYGYPKAPDEDVEVTILSGDEKMILHTELIPYDKFKRGDARWTTIAFEDPVTVPEKFWVHFQFNAERTKGVYVSYDKDSDGTHSRTGVPGADSKDLNFEGDWMMEAVLTKPE